MRLREIPFIRQVGHHIANRSRAQGIGPAPGDRTRANWFARLDVRANDGMQDFLLPGVQCSFAWHYKFDLPLQYRLYALEKQGVNRPVLRTLEGCSLIE